ncbi:MAG: hypothetical protein WAM14_18800 [Candidatus Nitrosopolaris sp.]
MVKKSYFIKDDLDVRVKMLAAQQHLTQSELVSCALEDYVKKHVK